MLCIYIFGKKNEVNKEKLNKKTIKNEIPPMAGLEVLPHLIIVLSPLFLLPKVPENFKNKPFIKIEKATDSKKNTTKIIIYLNVAQN